MSKLIVRDLQFMPPEFENAVEMTLEEKIEFYTLPLDVQLYYRQFDLALGEPELLKPEDEEYWFSKEPCVLVPNHKVSLPRGKYGGELGCFGRRSGDELTAWNNYLDGLATETKNYILSIIAQGEEPREGEFRYAGEEIREGEYRGEYHYAGEETREREYRYAGEEIREGEYRGEYGYAGEETREGEYAGEEIREGEYRSIW